jgi:hypothetical protein
MSAMALRWRLALAAVIAAAVLGGVLPHGALSGAEASASQMVQAVESPLAQPTGCADATCGKGSPAPAAPVPTVALVAVIAGLAVVAAAAAVLRRRSAAVAALPAGSRDRLFHPPQSS